MAKKRYTPEQIVAKIREAEVELSKGQTTPQVCKKLGVSEQPYYRWRREYGGLCLEQAKRLKTLERQNTRLKVSGQATAFFPSIPVSATNSAAPDFPAPRGRRRGGCHAEETDEGRATQRAAVDRDSATVPGKRSECPAVLRARRRSAQQPAAMAATAIRSGRQVRGDHVVHADERRFYELVARGIASQWRVAPVSGVARVFVVVAAAADSGVQRSGRYAEIVSRPGRLGAGPTGRGSAVRRNVRVFQSPRELRQARDLGSHGVLPVRQAARAGSFPSSVG